MKSARLVLVGASLVALLLALLWLGMPRGTALDSTLAASAPGSGKSGPAVFRLGLIPERNLFEQRRAYRLLAEYLAAHIRLPAGPSATAPAAPLQVELVTSSTYAGILQDFAAGNVDAAFLGSMTAVLAADRCAAQIILKSQTTDGADTYAGVIFVPADSPIQRLEDLKGKRLGGVATTSAAALFPVYAFAKARISPADSPRITWSGTHDDVIAEVCAGNLDAGAVKDLRLTAYEQEHPQARFRILASGGRMPENSLVARRDLNPQLRDAVKNTLLAMEHDPAAAPVLAALGFRRFEPCSLPEFDGIFDMIDAIGPRWIETGIDGPAPRRGGH